ncbi:UDP-glucose 4-epimerase GalE [Fusibacter paucivorans]|uniref:UDP-glucose 4-epimerase n=1 Tax=Fusibacter paucivorans TaxID=76009 RepID=A0ABS5PRK3_9FIRM|nr:UDP-glucose 4-epimerase GalE [Fusibacter paucivorans]MBS7527798.1 UDP-glucose 4-epimerase GalE [Fusibacter paucivorans]
MILILGGAGYIGSHAVRMILDQGEEVVVVDNLVTGHRAAVDERAIFYPIDIRDEAALSAVFDKYKIDVVLHFCASSLVGESMANPLKYFENNAHGAMVLLKVMKVHDVKAIVFSSTAAVYGEPVNVPIIETAENLPTNPYGESKLMMEKMFKWADAAYGIKYVSLRYFNVAGALPTGEIGEAHTIETHLIPLVLQVPLGKRTAIDIYGDDYPTKDGTCIRDYIHVVDLIEAHIAALRYLRDGGESDYFNLGSGDGFSVKEIVSVARTVTGHPIPSNRKPRRAGDPAVLIASSEKAKQKLGWHPERTDIHTIIEDAWRWHKQNPAGYDVK